MSEPPQDDDDEAADDSEEAAESEASSADPIDEFVEDVEEREGDPFADMDVEPPEGGALADEDEDGALAADETGADRVERPDSDPLGAGLGDIAEDDDGDPVETTGGDAGGDPTTSEETEGIDWDGLSDPDTAADLSSSEATEGPDDTPSGDDTTEDPLAGIDLEPDPTIESSFDPPDDREGGAPDADPMETDTGPGDADQEAGSPAFEIGPDAAAGPDPASQLDEQAGDEPAESAEDPFESPGSSFEEVDLGDVDRDEIWERLSAARDRGSVADVNERTYAEVSKHRFCESCKYFSGPPEIACSHEGTEILEFIDMEMVRLVDCPVVAERRELEEQY